MIASRKQRERAHNLLQVGHVGWPVGSVQEKNRARCCSAEHVAGSRSAGEGLGSARAHTCGAESITLLNIYSHFTLRI